MRVLIVAFVAGMLLQQRAPVLPSMYWLALLPVAGVAAAIRPCTRIPAAVLAGALWSLLHAHLGLSQLLPGHLEGRDLLLEGVVSSLPLKQERQLRFEFDPHSASLDGIPQDVPGRVRLSWYKGAQPVIAGQLWRLQVRLRRPRGFLNPGSFDYEGWLFRKGIGATGYIRDYPGNAYLGDSMAWTARIDQWRQTLRDRMGAVLGEAPSTGVLIGLVVGDRSAMESDVWEIFTATGTNHLMAISGLHIGLVAGMGFWVVRVLWSRAGSLPLSIAAPRAAAVAAVFCAGLYAALAGFALPTQRALVMLLVVAGAVIARRTVSASHTLALALLLVVLLDPLATLSPGFWLSFGAVAAIFYGLGGRLHSFGIWWRWGRVQWIVGIALLPLLLGLFERASLVSPVTNMIAVPWFSLLVVPLALGGAFLLLGWPPAGEWCLRAAALAADAGIGVLDWCAGFPIATWTWPLGTATSWVLGIGSVILLLAPRGVPGRWLGAVLWFPVLTSPRPAPADGEYWFTLLDVGQGLAAVVRTRGEVLVYDTGPKFSDRFDAGSAVVVPFLQRQRLSKVDLLVVSHADIDHAGGAGSLARALPVDRLVSGDPLQIEGVRSEPCIAGGTWVWSGVHFEFLHPTPMETGKGNDSSCVLRIDNGTTRLLLTGDVEAEAERALLARSPHSLSADIVVVPHHGSKGSSTLGFVEAVSPRLAVLGVGYRNRYGFPHAGVVQRWQVVGAEILETVRHGAITIRTESGNPDPVPVSYRYTARRFWNVP